MSGKLRGSSRNRGGSGLRKMRFYFGGMSENWKMKKRFLPSNPLLLLNMERVTPPGIGSFQMGQSLILFARPPGAHRPPPRSRLSRREEPPDCRKGAERAPPCQEGVTIRPARRPRLGRVLRQKRYYHYYLYLLQYLFHHKFMIQ